LRGRGGREREKEIYIILLVERRREEEGGGGRVCTWQGSRGLRRRT